MRRFFILTLLFLATATSASEEKIGENDIKNFSSALAQIKYFYIKDIPYSKLLQDSLKGMTRALDPHSDYLTEQEVQELNNDITGEFAGIGVSVIPEDGLIRVIAAIDDSPAKKAGIQGNDVIFKVANKLVSTLGVDAALKEIKGKPGTKVKIDIYRPETKKVIKLEISRAIMQNYPVKSNILGDNLLYIRIPMFTEKTGPAIKKILKKDNSEGIILDLRNNPGGLLSAAVEVSDLFLDAKKLKLYNKKIVEVKGRVQEFDSKFLAHNGDDAKNKPIAVLINHSSASASEIVAGALENHHRAIIIGTKSFGKGSVQTVIPNEKSALKITTALYYLPNGTTIQARGIEPDIYVNQLKVVNDDENMYDIIRESSNISHIKNETDEFGKKLNNKEISTLAAKDFQMYQAAKILETIILERK